MTLASFRPLPVLVVVCAAVLPASAGEGRIPIWEPVNLNSGGKYVVTNDIVGTGGPVIRVQNSTGDVDIDLNGFTLFNAPGESVIVALDAESLTVRNGTLQGGDGSPFGHLYADRCPRVVVEQVTSRGSGIYLHDAQVVVVRGNVVMDATNSGVFIGANFPAVVTGSIEDNVIRETGQGIEVVNGANVGILNNRVEGRPGAAFARGIYLGDVNVFLVSENTVRNVAGDGIRLNRASRGKLDGNVVTDCDGNGIRIEGSPSTDNLVLNNVSSGNAGNGLVMGGNRNHVDRNVFSANQQAGIWLRNPTNTFGRNTALGNLSPPGPCAFTTPPCAAPDICDDSGGGNLSFGDNIAPIPGC